VEAFQHYCWYRKSHWHWEKDSWQVFVALDLTMWVEVAGGRGQVLV